MSVQIIFKDQNEKMFWKYWEYCLLHKRAGPRYLKENIKLSLIVSKSNSLLYRDKSFIYLVDNEPKACVFFPLEKIEKSIMASSNKDYVFSPIFLDQSVEKKIFLIIDDIAKTENVGKIMFSIDPLESEEQTYNYLAKYNYLDTSLINHIINLESSCDTNDLLKNCHRRIRREIKKILDDKDFSTFIVDKDNPSYDLHEEYRALHHKCSGRVTRPKETFDLQFEKLKNGNAVLIGLSYKEKNIAYYYFDYSFDKALGFSSADDPDYDTLPLYHTLLFKQMEYLKKTGVRRINVGQPSSPSMQMNYYPDKKELNIAFFKTGFPGEFVQSFHGIKYFSRDIFERDIDVFVKRYIVA